MVLMVAHISEYSKDGFMVFELYPIKKRSTLYSLFYFDPCLSTYCIFLSCQDSYMSSPKELVLEWAQSNNFNYPDLSAENSLLPRGGKL